MKKSKTSSRIPRHWEKPVAIERVCGRDHEAVVDVGESEVSFRRDDNFDYFLVNTEEFQQFAPKGSVIEIFACDHGLKAGDVVLVAGNRRLEIMPYEKCKGLQIMGQVSKVHHWPGRKVVNYCN